MDFVKLGIDNKLAIGLVGVVLVVPTMVLLGFVELSQRFHLGDDRFALGQGAVQLFDELLRFPLLPLARIENDRAVLGAHVVSLTIERRRIVGSEEDREEIFIGDLAQIEFDPDDLRVSGSPAADLFIGRILHAPAGVSGHDRNHPSKLIEHSFSAPEAASAKNRDFSFLLHVLQ